MFPERFKKLFGRSRAPAIETDETIEVPSEYADDPSYLLAAGQRRIEMQRERSLPLRKFWNSFRERMSAPGGRIILGVVTTVGILATTIAICSPQEQETIESTFQPTRISSPTVMVSPIAGIDSETLQRGAIVYGL